MKKYNKTKKKQIEALFKLYDEIYGAKTDTFENLQEDKRTVWWKKRTEKTGELTSLKRDGIKVQRDG